MEGIVSGSMYAIRYDTECRNTSKYESSDDKHTHTQTSWRRRGEEMRRRRSFTFYNYLIKRCGTINYFKCVYRIWNGDRLLRPPFSRVSPGTFGWVESLRSTVIYKYVKILLTTHLYIYFDSFSLFLAVVTFRPFDIEDLRIKFRKSIKFLTFVCCSIFCFASFFSFWSIIKCENIDIFSLFA